MKFPNLKNKRVLIIGLQKSGLAAIRLLLKQGAQLYVTEKKDAKQLETELILLEQLNIEYEAGIHEAYKKFNPEIAIISPGVPLKSEIAQYLKSKNIPVYSEIELASWFFEGFIIAVSGSNGKTTVTEWLAHVLKEAGLKAMAVGNNGFPFAEMLVNHPEITHAVVEVSSYQLETIKTFKPDISILLNITPDHLERHGDMQGYSQAKARIWKNQRKNDWVIIPENDDWINSQTESIKAQKAVFSASNKNTTGSGISSRKIWLNINNNSRFILNEKDIPLPGKHNLNNGLAVIIAASLAGVNDESLIKGLKSFNGVSHRLEVIYANGIKWINDSKSTNVDSLKVALEATEEPIWLIAGGTDKGSSFDPVKALVKEKVKRTLLIGAAAERIESELDDCCQIVQCGDLRTAVLVAAKEAEYGTTILLSPACASFDQFRNFEHRGQVFRELVYEVNSHEA